VQAAGGKYETTGKESHHRGHRGEQNMFSFNILIFNIFSVASVVDFDNTKITGRGQYDRTLYTSRDGKALGD
jgi:hypothetical protein